VTLNGAWQHADLSQSTGAPPPAIDSFAAGYAWDPNSGSSSADIDQDGLSDDVERLMCTSPINPDSDHDAL
jgi:hypothetical protein